MQLTHRNLFCRLTTTTTADPNRGSSMAPGKPYDSDKPTTGLLDKPAKKPDTMPKNRLLDTLKAHKRSAITEKPRVCPEQRKKTVLEDLKTFALEFRLGPRVLPFQMPLNDTATIHSANSSTDVSVGRKRPSVFHSTHSVPLSAHAQAAFRGVSETSELLESIICYLPLKQILDVQRVSKRWKNVIAGSPAIQQKLFTRRENKKQEIWVLVKRRPVRDGILDRPQRVQVLPPPSITSITPVTLNPLLHVSRSWHHPNGPIFPISMLPTRLSVTFSAWANALRYNESCIRNMLVTDPPCTRAYIEYLIVYLGYRESRLQHPKPDFFDRNHPKQDDLCVKVSGITVESASGLTMRDIFKAAMNQRGNASCTLSAGFYHERGDTTLYEIIDMLMAMFGWTYLPESPFMELCMELSTLGSTSIMIATDADRELANAPWSERNEFVYKW